MAGVKDIRDDLEPGKREVRIHINQEKAALYGLTNNQIALAAKGAFEGLEATTLTANRIVEERIPEVEAKYPGIQVELGGEYEKTQESFSSLTRSFVITIILIYVILGTQFQSFIQPVVIMLTVPFSFIGVVLGLLVMGYPFSLVAFVGVVALAGIVVNDSLVLIDFINRSRRKGTSRWRAIIQSGKIRMRPILLTTITTPLGLLPMGLGIGGKSRVWGPMANTIIWGLGFATILTLFFIPAFYAIVDDLVGWLFKKEVPMG